MEIMARRMQKSDYTGRITAVVCALLLQGCGGGGSDPAPVSGTPSPPSASSVTTTGVITGFGSAK